MSIEFYDKIENICACDQFQFLLDDYDAERKAHAETNARLELEAKAHKNVYDLLVETKKELKLVMEAYNDCSDRLGQVRDAHAETNTRLEALEDAIEKFMSACNFWNRLTEEHQNSLTEAINNSKERGK